MSGRNLPVTTAGIVVVAGGLALLGAGLGRATFWPWVEIDDEAAFAAALSGQRTDRAALDALLRTARDAGRSGQIRAESVTLALALGLTNPAVLAEVTPLAEGLAVDPRVPAEQQQQLGQLLAWVSPPTASMLDGAELAAPDAVKIVLRDPTLTDEARAERLVALATEASQVRAWALLNAAWIEHGRRGLFLHAEARYREALAAADGDQRVAVAAQAGLDALDALRAWRATKLAAVTPKGEAPKVVDRGAPLDEGEEAQTP